MSRAIPPNSLTLTREGILSDSIRALVQAADPDVKLSTPEERSASIRAMLAKRPDSGDVWLFAYGSLIWNPLIHFVEKRTGQVRGYHRRFCLWTRARGTVEQPGLVLALERGGCCHGVAFRIAEDSASHELEVIWGREMLTGAYAPRWLQVKTAEGPLKAIGFVVNRTHRAYAGKLPDEHVIATIAGARGPLGACATYLFNTVARLEELGVRDHRLSQLRHHVAAKMDKSDA